MIRVIFTILGAITTYRLWGEHTGLAIFVIIATLYQASSLNEMFKEKSGLQPEDKVQTLINIITSVIIIGLLVYSFLI